MISPLLQKQSHLSDDYFDESETSASERQPPVVAPTLKLSTHSKKRTPGIRLDQTDLLGMESRKDRVRIEA